VAAVVECENSDGAGRTERDLGGSKVELLRLVWCGWERDDVAGGREWRLSSAKWKGRPLAREFRRWGKRTGAAGRLAWSPLQGGAECFVAGQEWSGRAAFEFIHPASRVLSKF